MTTTATVMDRRAASSMSKRNEATEEDETVVCLPSEDEPPVLMTTTSGSRSNLCDRARRLPWAVIRMAALGMLLLSLICACIIFETIRANRLRRYRVDGILIHSDNEFAHHMAIVNAVNAQNSTWTARYNKFASSSRYEDPDQSSHYHAMPEHDDVEEMHDSLDETSRKHIITLKDSKQPVPVSFDARQHWPLCWTVHQVPNQGGCGSCWAAAATSVMSDRICIHSGGKWQPQISAQDLTSCCVSCGGCQGSHLAIAAFNYWKEVGIVTGGPFGSYEGCRPYEISPDCGTPCSTMYYREHRTGECNRECQALYSKQYDDDQFFAESAYWIRADRDPHETKVQDAINVLLRNESIETIIKREIFLHGPILACFTVFEDFQHYHSGIYKRRIGGYELYGHCAKLMGWGVENGTAYWLYMNTWGRNWGENGFFRVNIAETPEEIVAGLTRIGK
uniref:Peptidase C1A papain C-terminal domain-containing protein n=1 Tax=Plectus sambesii TaxID=2011161 RepID=A0A914VX65_9BILA